MFYVPIYVEMLRSRPGLVFWAAALAQALVWLAVPVFFYTAPPGDLAQLLAIGHGFRLDAGGGPPPGLLAGRDCLPRRRHVRCLSLGADLRGDDLLVRLRARSRYRRSGARRHGGA